MAKLYCLGSAALQSHGLLSCMECSTSACVAATYGQEQLNALPQLDGLTATMMDEAILMREPLLKHYWSSVACFSQSHCEDLIRGNTDAIQVAWHPLDCLPHQGAVTAPLPCRSCMEPQHSAVANTCEVQLMVKLFLSEF